MQLQPLKVWQELADITSMAIDHFNEKIAPALEKAYRNTLSNRSSCKFSLSNASPKEEVNFEIFHFHFLNRFKFRSESENPLI